VIAWLVAGALAQDLAIYGQTVLPIRGPALTDGVVLVHDGKITSVGPAAGAQVPEGARELRGAVVMPGAIDGLSVAGLTGPLNRPPDQDHKVVGLSVAPELRAIDAYSAWDELVTWLREHGVTTVHTGPSPGAPVGGRTLVTTTAAGPLSMISVVDDAMVVVTLGEGGKEWEGAQTRMGSAALVRQAFAEAADYRERRKLPLADRPPSDLGHEALIEAMDKRRKVVIVAHRADDLLTALRIRDEFGLDVILAGASEAWLIRAELARAGAPVLVGPVMARQWSHPGERHDATFENAGLLADAGVTVGLMSGFEDYVPKVRVVLWEAAVAATHGLGSARALEAVTLGNARILGIESRKGSLEPGKDADVLVLDGDPLEPVTHVCAVIIEGAVVSEECR
jgi:imidazolonepropionase-like amidohydrolase